MEAKQLPMQAMQNIYWKFWIYLNYLFGVNNRWQVECRGIFIYERAISFS